MVEDAAHETHSEVAGRNHRTATARDITESTFTFGDTNHYHAPLSTPRRPLAAPRDLHDFHNRDSDLVELDGFLASGLPTCLLAGTAGVGKTSLAVHWAQLVQAHFPDGHLYVDLGAFQRDLPADPHLVLGRFLPALGISAAELPDVLDARSALFRSVLAERTLLIILDNAASAEQVRPLLPGAGSSRALVTSRYLLEGLGLQESVFRHGVEVFPEDEAIAMVAAIMGAERSTADPQLVTAASRLCAALPLAMRIFAQRARNRPFDPLSDLVEDLQKDPAGTLSAGDIAVDRALGASYADLDPANRQLFRRLGWFPAPEFSIGAAAALAGLTTRAARQALDALTAATLLQQTGPGRYRMHDLLHRFAAERAADEPRDEQEAAIRRLLRWYLECAASLRAIAPYEQSSPQVAVDWSGEPGFTTYREAMSWFDSERGDLVAVVRLAAASGEQRYAWQIAAALGFIYAHTGFFDDWRAITMLGLAAAEQDGIDAGMATLTALHGMVCKQTGKFGEALVYYHEALEMYEAHGDRHGLAWGHNLIGYLHLAADRLEQADTAFGESLALCRSEGLDHLAILPAEGLGCVLRARGDHEGALTALETALTAHHEATDTAQQFGVLVEMAITTLKAGHPNESARHARTALDLARDDDFGSSLAEGIALVALGDALRAAGRREEALPEYLLAGQIQFGLGDIAGRNDRYRTAAALYRELGQDSEAIRYDELAESSTLGWDAP